MRADDLLNELSYKQNIGAMETYKFYSVATPEQKYELKRLIAEKNFKEAWRLIKQVTGLELQDLGTESTITDYERAVMEGGHSIEEPARRSALREAVVSELTGWKQSQPAASTQKRSIKIPSDLAKDKDQRSELQKRKDSGNKNWFRIKEDDVAENYADGKKLVIFDIDDTLVHTQTKVHVINNDTVVKSLNSHEFTHYKLKPNEHFDFGDFRDAREFFANAKPIIPMINQLKQDIATGNKVVMVTARADFNDRELFLDTFRKYGINMKKVHVYRAGNLKDGSTEDRKKRIIGSLLSAEEYSKAIMYDDALPNLDSFISLKQEFPNTKFYAWHVSLDGVASEYHRTDETSRGEHEGQKGVAEDSENYGGIQLSLEIEKDDEYVDDEDTDNQTIYVTATSNGRELGHVLFTIDYDSQGMVLNPQDLEVDERFRGQGIAATMYDYVKSKGYRIRRSGQQTDAGAAFWDKHKPGKNIWEQGVAEAGPFSYGYKKPRKGSVADLAAKRRKEQEKNKPPIEPKDQMVGTAKVTKSVAEEELDEDWKSTAASLAAAAGIAGAGYGGMAAKQSVGNYFKEPIPTTQQVKAFTPKIDTTTLQAKKQEQPQVKQPEIKPQVKKSQDVKPITSNPLEAKLLSVAKANGLKGTELAAFMAQCAHETLDFKRMVEFGGKLDFKKYDPKHAPKKAKALGNKHAGDGERYKGRGFIQITGRYNYKKAGEELGLPLEQKPQLVEDPEIAAKVAVWFWKHRVQPNVDNFHDVVDVTKYINPAMRGLKDRKENFKEYMSAAEQQGRSV